MSAPTIEGLVTGFDASDGENLYITIKVPSDSRWWLNGPVTLLQPEKPIKQTSEGSDSK